MSTPVPAPSLWSAAASWGWRSPRELTRRWPGVKVVVLEKEDRVGAHQTGHNSGVVHAGIYYKPGSLKAELCTRGRCCSRSSAPSAACPTTSAASSSSRRSRRAGPVRGAGDDRAGRWRPRPDRVEGSAITDIEPAAADWSRCTRRRRRSPTTCAVAAAYAAGHRGRGWRGAAVDRGQPTSGAVRRHRRHHRSRADALDRLVVCAGLTPTGLPPGRRRRRPADRAVPRGVHERARPQGRPRARDDLPGARSALPVPRRPLHAPRGRWPRGRPERRAGPGARGLPPYGRVVGRRAEHGDLAGHLADGAPALASGLVEMRGSLSVTAYMRTASRYVPDRAATWCGSGRACAPRPWTATGRWSRTSGSVTRTASTTVRNAPSPAATSSLAIAEHVVDRIESDG